MYVKHDLEFTVTVMALLRLSYDSLAGTLIPFQIQPANALYSWNPAISPLK